jgi:hypothetical protein
MRVTAFFRPQKRRSPHSMRPVSRLLLLGSLLFPTAALAQPAAPAPALQATTNGQHTHDGFFLRMIVGLGGTRMTGTSGPTELKVSGSGGGFGFALGGAVAPNLILFGEVVDSIATNPRSRSRGTDSARARAAPASSASGPASPTTSTTTSTSPGR